MESRYQYRGALFFAEEFHEIRVKLKVHSLSRNPGLFHSRDRAKLWKHIYPDKYTKNLWTIIKIILV